MSSLSPSSSASSFTPAGCKNSLLVVPNEDRLRKATQARFPSPLSNCLVVRRCIGERVKVAFTTFLVERTVFLCLHLLSCSLSSPLLSSPLASLCLSVSLSLSLSLCLSVSLSVSLSLCLSVSLSLCLSVSLSLCLCLSVSLSLCLSVSLSLCLCLFLSLCLGSPSHGWWRAKRRCASLVLDGYRFDVLAEWNMLCILKLMLHVQHRIWLLGAFVLLSKKHMQPTSFVFLALDLARSV